MPGPPHIRHNAMSLADSAPAEPALVNIALVNIALVIIARMRPVAGTGGV